MGLATKRRKTWLCPKCSTRNEHRTSSRKCGGCGEPTKPKRRVPKHAEVLRDVSFEKWAALSVQIHGGELYACGVCQRPMSDTRRPDRDHDHRTGKARGLACVRCNRELLRHATLEEARAVVAYLERAEAFNGGT